MVKTELVNKVALIAGGTKKLAKVYLDAVIEAIVDTVAEGQDLKLSGLGAIKIIDRPERKCFNVVTKKVETVPSGKRVVFRLSKSVRDLVK